MPQANQAENALDVLVVDDEPEVRDLLVEHLRVRGCRVASAMDGRSAIVAVERAPFTYALVLTDLHMPGASGLDVLKAVRACNPAIYVVIITGYASLDSAIQAVRLGAYDYLTKPFSLGQIDVLLSRVRDRRLLEAENRRLHRQVDERCADPSHTPTDRIAAIEDRLATIERLLQSIAIDLSRIAR